MPLFAAGLSHKNAPVALREQLALDSDKLSEVLRDRNVAHSVDDWGAEGGHDWPYWKRQMIEYLSRLPW